MKSITTRAALFVAITITVFSTIFSNPQLVKSSDGTTDEVRVRIEVEIPKMDNSAEESVEEVFLSGNLNLLGEWRPNGLKLKRADQNVYFAEFSAPAGSRVQYKVTRGSWQSVEKDQFGKDIPNREFVTTATDKGDPQTIKIIVQRWGAPKSVKSTITGTVKLHEKVASQHLLRTRNVSVWLPIEYEASETSYPVLYLQDGQNLFDVSTAAFGVEWEVDESAMDLMKKQEIPPMIIVGIWNTVDRMDEYTLTKDERLGHGGRGLDYIRFVAEELKPFIDRTYRTQVDRESTIIGGSSLGGLISMHACLEKPNVFGKCLAFSPTLGWDQEELLQSLHNGTKWPASVRLWFSMGTREGRDSETQNVNRTRAERLHQLLSPSNTTTSTPIQFQEFAEASHDEKSWAAQFPIALKSIMVK
jgi:predicted alpha/beta superfamily hydrolase